MPHKIPSLRSTKGMDALPLRRPVKGSSIDRFNSFPTEVCEMESGDGRRSARRNRETGCQDGPIEA